MPLSVRIGLLIILLALSGALALTARRAQQGSLRRNGLVGVRTPTAVLDNRRFEVANLAAIPYLFVASGLALALGLLVALTAMRWAGGSLGVVVGGILIGGTVLLGGIRGEAAAKRDLATHPSVSGTADRKRGRPGSAPATRRSGSSKSGRQLNGRGGGPRRPSR